MSTSEIRLAAVLIALSCADAAFTQDHSAHKAGGTSGAEASREETRIAVSIPVDRQRKIGVRTAPVTRKQVTNVIRTVGTVTANEQREAHVHTRINGWIERIHADFVGKPVKKGEPLFDLYAPEIASTQEEYLSARGRGRAGKEIANAALERLRLWGVPESEVRRLVRTGKTKRAVTFESPVDGFIVRKTAIQGMYVTSEMELYHIADLSEVWVIVTLYEFDLSVVSVGDQAVVTLPYDPSRTFRGPITYIYPEVETQTRTAKARVEVKNADQDLKPGMFANVEVQKSLGEAIVVPEDAVIDTGTRRIVFVRKDGTSFEPREIRIGPRVEGAFVILSGLKAGEEIVTSAHFLIDAESKIQAALDRGAAPSGHGGHGGHESDKDGK